MIQTEIMSSMGQYKINIMPDESSIENRIRMKDATKNEKVGDNKKEAKASFL